MRKSAQTVTRRGQGRPPKNVAQFIELVNAERLYERELDDPCQALYAAMDEPANASVSERVMWIRACEEIATKLHPETREFLGPVSDLNQFLVRYKLLESAREVLLGIAARYGSSGLLARSSELMIYDARLPVEVPFSVTVNLVVNDKGLLGASDNLLLHALIGVRADRIRACTICSRIFWAPRINSECCGEKCRKTYNQRCSRKNRQLRQQTKLGRKESKKGRNEE